MRTERALVSGAGGFIGSHLVEYLLEAGYQVRALVHYHSNGQCGWLDHSLMQSHPSLEILRGDIRDPFWVQKVCEGMDRIFHLAALIAIPHSYEAPASYVETNLQGSLNFLQAARNTGCQRIVLMSSSEVYGTAKEVPIRETHPLQGQSPYSASKIGMEAMGMAYFRSFDTPVSLVRPFNNYGPRQSLRGVIPSIVIQLLRGTQELRLGHLAPTRDFLYVRDCVAALEQVGRARDTLGEIVNIATGTEHSIGQLAQQLVSLIQAGTPISQEAKRLRPENSEVFRLCGSAEKLHALTGWTPAYSFESGLQETVDWFAQEANLNLYPKRSYHT